MIQKNDEYVIKITDLGMDGEGIGKICLDSENSEGDNSGYTVFVKDALIGDIARIKIIKAKKSFGYGRLMEILEPSPYRVTPKCPVARACGGCQIMHLSYEQQLRFKENKVKNLLERIGKLRDYEMLPLIGMKEPYYYRNKAQFPVGKNKEGKIVIGFYAGRTHSIIDTEHCYIQHPLNEKLVHIVKQWMEKYKIEPYEEETQKGLIRHILTRVGKRTGQVMVCLVINGTKLPYSDALISELCAVEGMTSISININRENTNVILGNEVRALWGLPYITDYIGDICYQISPLSFYQVNPEQTQVLYRKALEFANLKEGETVWDLYCGIGTISLFLAQKAARVYGVEIVPQAIEDAKKNAALNHMDNVEFFVGKAEEVLPREYEKNHIYADVIVVDPPRKGCDASLLDCMVKMAPKRIVYVSCDPATLARDLRVLGEKGYEVVKVQGVDMFPGTVHVETVCLLSKLHSDHHIEVELEMDELDLTAAESKATYEEIKDYVLKQSGSKVSNLYIAQVKQKCGIIERANYNLTKSENSRQPKCPPEKEAAIREALEHFRMI